MNHREIPLIFFFESASGIGIFRYHDPKHELDDQLIFKVASGLNQSIDYDSNDKIGFFNLEGSFQQFCFHLCQSLKRSSIGVVSAENFNQAIGQSFNDEELIGKLYEEANYIDNPEIKEGKNFIKNLFKP